jgi:hypothetical protein
MPTSFNLINRQFFGSSANGCSSEFSFAIELLVGLDKRQPNDIKRNVPLALEPRAEVAVLAFRLAHRSQAYGHLREENHSCGGEISLRPEQFWEQ